MDTFRGGWRLLGMGLLAVAVLAACGPTPPSQPPDAQPDGGGGDTTADGGTNPGGAPVRFAVQAVERCAVNPTPTPGLSRATPTAARVGIIGLELLRSRLDPEPFQVSLPSALVEVDALAGGVVAEAVIPAGTWPLMRYVVGYGSVTVPAKLHPGGQTVPGTVEYDIATSPHRSPSGEQRTSGQLVARMSAFGNTSEFRATVSLDCPLSESGGFVETGSTYRVTVPVPGGPLVVRAGDALREVKGRFPLSGAVTWTEKATPGFATGALDIAGSSDASEAPARLPICDLLLTDRCEADARPARLRPAWPMPDASTVTCNDGTAVAPCPQEGQPLYGQAGNYAVRPAQLTPDGDVVRDGVTGLVWQRVAPEAALDWWGAQAYCRALRLDGRDDWSLPSRLELASLIDDGRFGPSIDLAAFPDAPSDFFWSASPALFSHMAFGIRFDQGFIYDHDPRNPARVRCVAGGRDGPQQRLTVRDETVYDEATRLEWQRALNPAATWAQALATCEALTLAGHDDWRLPSEKQLLTIVEDAAISPSVDLDAFPGTPAEWMWASSAAIAPPDYAWSVSFTDGFSAGSANTQLFVYRCVRGG